MVLIYHELYDQEKHSEETCSGIKRLWNREFTNTHQELPEPPRSERSMPISDTYVGWNDDDVDDDDDDSNKIKFYTLM